MLRVSLSDSLLQTVFLPGLILLFAIGWIAGPCIWIWIQPSIAQFDILGLVTSRDTEFSGFGVFFTGLLALGVLLLYLLAMFLGSLLAVAVGYLEYYGFDMWQAYNLGIGLEEYKGQWHRYLDSLEKARNPYISKQATAFHFQARSALALLMAALAIPVSLPQSGFIWAISLGLLIFAGLLFKGALDDHQVLAEFRLRRFSLKADAASKPEESLRALVDAWCRRSEVTPLRLVLPVLSRDAKEIPDPAKASDVLQSVLELKDTEVLPSEKCTLRLAVAALSDRARKGAPATPCTVENPA